MLNQQNLRPTTGKPEPVHRVIEEPLRPVGICEVHLYLTRNRNPDTGRKVKGFTYDVLFVYDRIILPHHWVENACEEFAHVITSWMLRGCAKQVGEVMYFRWDGGWAWYIM